MTDTNQKQLGNTLWSIADHLRGAIEAAITAAREKHNAFLTELDLPPLPGCP